MSIPGTALVTGFLIAGAALPAACQATNAARTEEAYPGRERIEALAGSLVEVARLPSFSMAVLQGDSIVYRAAFGYADVERGVAASPDTRYRMASVSKMFTITALARLVQDGGLDLDAPAARYLPGFPGTDGFTTRQLAGHLSGLGHYQAEDRMEPYRAFGSVTEALDVFRGSPRAGPPGAQYYYSTHGYTLLSAIMEAAAGTPFLEYVTQAVLDPLGLEATGPRHTGEAAPQEEATLYLRNGAQPVEVRRPFDKSYSWAGAGFVSTPSDMVRLAAGYWKGFLDSTVVADFWTRQSTNDGQETIVGVGWRIGADFAGRRIIHHSGSDQGARTTLVLYPEERTAIATATNVVWVSSIEKNAQVLLAALRGHGGIPSLESGTYRLSGTFSADSTVTTLTVEGGRGAVVAPAPMREWFGRVSVDTLPLFHIEGDLWALVTPYGVADLRLGPSTGAVLWSEARSWRFRVSPVSGSERR